MKVVYCENGHFYDADTYQRCPHCGAGERKNHQPGSQKMQEEKAHWWSFSGRKKEKTVTRDVPGENPHSASKQKEPTGEPLREQEEEHGGEPELMQQNREDSPAPQAQDSRPTDLEEQIRKAAGNRDGKTYGYFQEMVEASHQADAAPPADPVVGWLVAVKGPHFGASFELHAGKNVIGRNPENDVVLDRDNGVSRSCHATVIYEPKKRDFYLQPGAGSALTYYNGDFIAEVKKMEQRSTIEVGGTELLVCMLCGSDFCWEERMDADREHRD